jgi:hypothetical protein
MKFGSTVLLIIAIFIAFGFVISDDLQVRNDLAKASQNLVTCQNGVLNSQQIISQLENDKAGLIRTVTEKENEIVSLETEITQQVEKVAEMEQKVTILENKSQPVQTNNSTLPITGDNPLVFVGLLVIQIALNLVQKGWQFIRNSRKVKGEYIFLSPEETTQIISSRRRR